MVGPPPAAGPGVDVQRASNHNPVLDDLLDAQ
jgi:hypothetical protein